MTSLTALDRGSIGDGTVRLGVLTTVSDSLSAEILGRSGFDWVGIDMQHGALGDDAMFPVLQALALTGTPALVRVRWNEPAAIMRALDAGAAGVIVPMVETAEQAASAVAACRYPPAGVRSWGPVRARYLLDPYTAETADASMICAVMIETQAGLDVVRSVAEVPGLDAIFIGPSDLALSLGHSPSLDQPAPAVAEAITTIVEACARANIVAGIFTAGSEPATRWAAQGFGLISVHSDRLLMAERAQQILQEIRSRVASTTPGRASV